MRIGAGNAKRGTVVASADKKRIATGKVRNGVGCFYLQQC